jgi:hypothetical protein
LKVRIYSWHGFGIEYSLSHEALHARSQLFMFILMGKSYQALVAQALT